MGTVRINQLEVTYYNRIRLASARISEVFPDCVWRKEGRILSSPEAIELAFSFKSQDTIKPAVHQGEPEMRFELTVRGMQREKESLQDWFDAGRVWIVTAFADLTGGEWHKKWGRTE
ncbi:MAG: hypothetical protein ACE5KM_21270 [Planctomycetaceae bacterium]